MKLKQNSVMEASNSEVEASWRGAEAVEASLTLHMDCNQVDLQGNYIDFYGFFQVSVIFWCDLEQAYVKSRLLSRHTYKFKMFKKCKVKS